MLKALYERLNVKVKSVHSCKKKGVFKHVYFLCTFFYLSDSLINKHVKFIAARGGAFFWLLLGGGLGERHRMPSVVPAFHTGSLHGISLSMMCTRYLIVDLKKGSRRQRNSSFTAYIPLPYPWVVQSSLLLVSSRSEYNKNMHRSLFVPLHLKSGLVFTYCFSWDGVLVRRWLRNSCKCSAKPGSRTQGQRTSSLYCNQKNGRHSSSWGWSSNSLPQIHWLQSSDPTHRFSLPPLIMSHLFGVLELSTMGTLNDQAVLQAIFNPDTPFGDVVGLDLEEEAEEDDKGEYMTLEDSSLHWVVCRPSWGSGLSKPRVYSRLGQ